ncbi:MAG: hypothetical protein ACLPSH_18540 [Vulcanimicrobiaceae bacterium]
MAPVDNWKGHIRALIYGVQFEADPLDGADRVLQQVVQGRALGATPAQYLASIGTALAGAAPLADLIPQGHSEETIRQFLRELERRIEGIV